MSAAPLPRAERGADLARFAPVNAWVFDLDNTLYPRHSNIFPQISERVNTFLQRLLGVSREEALRVDRYFHDRYGVTLRGLIVEHGITPDAFLEYVHDIDHSSLQPDPALAAAIERLPGRKFILTNGSRRHAEKIAERLGITRHFEDIFDIVRSELVPKPNRESYDRFIAATGVRPGEAAMFEDLSRNLLVPQKLGMATVLVVPDKTIEIVAEAWEQTEEDDAHIDFVTDDLGGFLEGVLAAIGAV
jgi:putative hydrolase of the HAD superfamily